MSRQIQREQLQEKLAGKEDITIIEALPAEYYQSGHLPGALNIPHDEIQLKAEQILPDKDALIVVYCANRECQNSRLASETLQQMGYTNTYEYVEGKQHWQEANLPLESSQAGNQ